MNLLSRIIDTSTDPLLHVIRDDAEPIRVLPPLSLNLHDSEEHGSVQDYLVVRMSHHHPMFKDDNAKAHCYLYEAARSFQCAVSTKPCHKKNNGRDVFIFSLAMRWKRKMGARDQEGI